MTAPLKMSASGPTRMVSGADALDSAFLPANLGAITISAINNAYIAGYDGYLYLTGKSGSAWSFNGNGSITSSGTYTLTLAGNASVSGTNSGDETQATIISKLNVSGDASISSVGVVTVSKINGATPAASATTDTTTTANISDSANKRFVTDAQKTVLSNTSGANSGDETQSSIATKLAASGDASISTAGVVAVVAINGTTPSAKNYIVNGDFGRWQVGTSRTTSGYLADQWYCTINGGASFAQVTLSSGMNAIAWTATTTDASQLMQPLEQAAVIPLRGKTVTFSIYCKVASFSGYLAIVPYYSNSSDARTSLTTVVSAGVNIITPSTTLTRYSATFTMPSDAVGIGFWIYPYSNQSAGAVVTVTMVQLELGSVATPFESLPPAMEMVRCQRFFEMSYPQGSTPGSSQSNAGFAMQLPSAAPYMSISTPFKAEKRATPTVTIYDLAGTSNKMTYQATASGGTWNNGGAVGKAVNGTSNFAVYGDGTITTLNSIKGHWTADCRL